MKIFSKQSLIVLVVIALISTFMWLMFTQGPLARVKVSYDYVQQGDLPLSVFGIGTVESRYPYSLGTTQTARIKQILVDQGDVVRVGQLLATLDPVDLDFRIQSAQSALDAANFALISAQAQWHEASNKAQLAKTNAQRYREMYEKRLTSKESLDAKQSEAVIASANQDAAKAAVSGAEKVIERLKKDQEGLRVQRNNLNIISPIDGVVVAREAEVGNTIVAGQSVLRLVNPADIWVKVRIDQHQAGGIHAGQRVQLKLRSQPNNALSGVVARIEAQGDSISQETFVDVTFDNLPHNWVLAELVQATIELPTIEQAVFVPSAAIKRLAGQTGVWRQDAQHKAYFQPVILGAVTLDGRTQILSGLAVGDEIIVYSPIDLSAGMVLARMASRD